MPSVKRRYNAYIYMHIYTCTQSDTDSRDAKSKDGGYMRYKHNKREHYEGLYGFYDTRTAAL
jgi:hypothetical protein